MKEVQLSVVLSGTVLLDCTGLVGPAEALIYFGGVQTERCWICEKTRLSGEVLCSVYAAAAVVREDQVLVVVSECKDGSTLHLRYVQQFNFCCSKRRDK